MTNDRRLYVFLGAIVIVALIGSKLIPAHKHKERQRTARERSQNACSVRAYTKYTQDKIALMRPKDSSAPSNISVEKIVARRRLEEDFCVEFVACANGNQKSESPALQSTMKASQFDTCLRDEALEDYDAVLREDGDDASAKDD